MSYITKLVNYHDITFLCEHWLQHSEINLVNDIFCDNICYFQSSINYVSFNNVPVLAALDKTTTAEVTEIEECQANHGHWIQFQLVC